MSYSRYGGSGNRNQGGIPSPWAGGAQAGGNQDLSMNLLGSLMNNGSGNMASLATSLVAQALQNKPGGLNIGGNQFGGPMGGSSFNNSGPRGGGYMDRGRDDYRRGPSSNSSRSARPAFRRSRSRSRDRSRSFRRDNDSSSRNTGPHKRMRAGSPKDRAAFEVYIGNYPVRFREHDVRNLFQEHGVTVTTIRLKHDGHKVFAFAETSSEEEVQKAIKAMDSKEIHGRRLRVRSSKDKDDKNKQATEEKKRPQKRELTEDDVSRHLVFAFNGFLDRQIAKIADADEEKAKKIEEARDLLKEAFDIPDDDSLKISRNLELIFLHNNRREIPIPEEPKEEKTKEEAETTEGDAENGDEVEGEADVKEENADEEPEVVEEVGDAVEDETNAEEGVEENEAAEGEEGQEEEEQEAEAKTPAPSSRGGRGRGRGRGRRGA